VKTWDIPGRIVTGKAAQAQEWICRQSERYLRLADEMTAAVNAKPAVAFSWIHGREI